MRARRLISLLALVLPVAAAGDGVKEVAQVGAASLGMFAAMMLATSRPRAMFE